MAATSPHGDITRLLEGVRNGDDSALDHLLPMVYGELKRIATLHMRGEREDHTLSPTAVLHEAFLRMTGGGPIRANDSAHFLRLASQMMRHVLIDYARARASLKRDAKYRVTLDENVAISVHTSGMDLIALDAALSELADAEPRWAQVVELRFFAGLEIPEVASVLGISASTVKRDWQFAKAWLAHRLDTPSTA